MRFAVIALRNLARNRRRTLLSLMVIAAGTVALLLTAGFIRFSFEGLQEAIVRGGLGHLEVAPAGGGAAGEAGEGRPEMEGWQEVRAAVEQAPHVLAAGAALRFSGIASLGERSAAVLGIAVEPDRERRMRVEVKVQGEDLPGSAPAEGEDQVLLGEGLARTLGASRGDLVTITAITVDGTLNALDVKAVGVLSTGLKELDSRVVKMHLVSAQRLLGTDEVASLVVGLDDTSHTAAVKADLERRLAALWPGLRVTDWEARAPFYGQVRALYGGIFWFLGGIVVVLVALATSNTLLMSLLERMREIGALLAIGTSRGQVAALILIEGLWLGLLGALLGSAVGLGLTTVINAAGIQMPPPPGAASPLDLHLLPRAGDVAGICLLMVVTLGTAALVPALRAVRVRIVDALGHV